MTHNNNAEIKLANGANAGGLHTNPRSLDVFHEPNHLPLQQLLLKTWFNNKQDWFWVLDTEDNIWEIVNNGWPDRFLFYLTERTIPLFLKSQ